jgi:hypothetical protein
MQAVDRRDGAACRQYQSGAISLLSARVKAISSSFLVGSGLSILTCRPRTALGSALRPVSSSTLNGAPGALVRWNPTCYITPAPDLFRTFSPLTSPSFLLQVTACSIGTVRPLSEDLSPLECSVGSMAVRCTATYHSLLDSSFLCRGD